MSERNETHLDLAQELFREVERRSDPFRSRLEIETGTDNVILITEDGDLLGKGTVGQYDWFVLRWDQENNPTYRLVHRGPSSKRLGAAFFREVIPVGIDAIIDEIAR